MTTSLNWSVFHQGIQSIYVLCRALVYVHCIVAFVLPQVYTQNALSRPQNPNNFLMELHFGKYNRRISSDLLETAKVG